MELYDRLWVAITHCNIHPILSNILTDFNEAETSTEATDHTCNAGIKENAPIKHSKYFAIIMLESVMCAI